MQIKFPHPSTEAEGIARVKQLLVEHRAKISEQARDLKEVWNANVLSFSFTAQGTYIEGTLTVRDKEYDLYAKLPLALRLFEGTIEKMIAAEVKKLSV